MHKKDYFHIDDPAKLHALAQWFDNVKLTEDQLGKVLTADGDNVQQDLRRIAVAISNVIKRITKHG